MNGMASERTILVVDDDAKIVRLVRTYLEHAGFNVIEAGDGQAALAAIALDRPALVVLDVMLPSVDGLAVLEAVRRTSRVPVIMLSARAATDDRIEGLELGADDYLAKPFSPAELVVRVRRILDRSAESASIGPATPRAPLRVGDLTLDPERHEVLRQGTTVSLTLAEFRLLAALLSADGRVLTRDQLIDALHGADGLVLDRTIDVHIRRLRRKLGDDPGAPRYVATVRGVGYRVPTST
jgi:two-component system alkaline phosphatase synthesis response regulator PhoP